MRAIRFGAFRIDVERMFLDNETPLLGNLLLAAFDFFVVELFDSTTVDAHEVVVVLPGFDLENRLA